MVTSFDPPLTGCPACGGPRLVPYHADDRGRRFSRCRDCTLLFMNPQYSDAYLAEYYAGYTVDEPDKDDSQRLVAHFYLAQIAAQGRAGGRLLDVGCGRGDLLKAARERGWEVTGYDVDPATVARYARELDVPLLTGEFTELPLPAAHFDAICMLHVIEHLKDPRPVLARIHRLLKPGGLLFLAQPNIHGFSSRLKFALEKAGLRRRNVGSYFDADHHVLYFTPRSLSSLARRAGFDVLQTRSAPKVKRGDADWRWTRRQAVSHRLWPPSSFTLIARRRSDAGDPPHREA